jgi:hypothetical protein
MIDNTYQDEWFNLYLYTGSIVDTRYSILETGYRNPKRSPDLNQKESRSIDRAENLTELEAEGKGVSTQKSSWKSSRLRTRILNQFQITYWRRISSWTDFFIINLCNVCRSLRSDPTDFSNHFSSLNIR